MIKKHQANNAKKERKKSHIWQQLNPKLQYSSKMQKYIPYPKLLKNNTQSLPIQNCCCVHLIKMKLSVQMITQSILIMHSSS